MAEPRFPKEFLAPSELQEIEGRIRQAAEAGRDEEAWEGVQSLLPAARRQDFVALSVVSLIDEGHLSIERALETLALLYAAHRRNESVLGPLGAALSSARDIDMLNDPPPEHPLFADVVSSLTELSERARGTPAEFGLLLGLGTAARMMARQRDEVVERTERRLLELAPDMSNLHYNLGLFLKTRGRFRDGMLANQAAERLRPEPPAEYEWNLGICATGAGEGAVALEVWKRLNQKIEIGRLGLPNGKYARVKVRLAQRPLAERTRDTDDPGLEESIWIERLSPCHGIVRSVLFQDLGVDYGDTVLFDGAPITYHTYGTEKTPVFPHLATLHRGQYQKFDFAGTQREARQLADASSDLEGDAIIYSHSESYVQLCASCWRNPGLDHEHDASVDEHIVVGRIAAPPDLEPRELLRQLDEAMAKREGCRLYVPALCAAAGFADRAEVERRRFEMVTAN